MTNYINPPILKYCKGKENQVMGKLSHFLRVGFQAKS